MQRTYTIKEAAALTGLPASTLRYYESIGVISPVERGESSKHRVFTDADLDQLMWVACLGRDRHVGQPHASVRSERTARPDAAGEQIELLTAQQARLMREAEFIELRQRYVQLKIDYWQAIAAGDDDRAERLSSEARSLADDLKQAKHD